MIAYLTAIATLVGVRALLTLGLNVQWGLAGLVNLGAVAFFAVGAYTSALLAVAGTPLLFAWPAAIGFAAAAAAGLAMVALRLREDYLAIVTLGFGEVLRLFLLNEAWLTRGANGVTGIPRPLHARSALRSASAPRISRRSATRATSPSSRCSATSPSGTTSRRRP